MQTVDKAMQLLGYFSQSSPEIGLSELARQANFDKATTRRLLVSLEKHGLVEQDQSNRKYHLGASILRLARVREATYPIDASVEPILEKLAETTGETAHFSLAAGGGMATIGLRESRRANRVSMEHGELLPFHCTASGLAYLAFAPDHVTRTVLDQPLASHTSRTVTTRQDVEAAIERARRDGVGVCDQGYEIEVFGIAAPVFNWSGFACGAVAVATPVSRMTDEINKINREAVRAGAVDITRALGAVPHDILTSGGGGRQ